MAYLQVGQLLSHAHALRERVREVVLDCTGEEPDEILAELLSRLDDHDSRMQQLLERHKASSLPLVLDTWVQYTETKSIEQELEALGVRPQAESGCSTAEALEVASAVDQRVIELFELARAQAPTPRVLQFFEDLLEMEKQHAQFKSRNQVEAEDLRSIPGGRSD